MHKSILSNGVLAVICTLISIQSAAQSSEVIDNSYKPPVFMDLERGFRAAQSASSVDAMYSQYAERTNTPGLVYAVVLDGDIVYSGGFGQANISSDNSVSNQTLFRVASMSKAITAQAILQLRDEGRLSLDDPASQYIPEVGDMALPTTDSANITLRHLLTHTAGFPEDNAWADRQLAMSNPEFVNLIDSGVAFSTVTGEQYEYSNVGYSLLGQIIEVVSGQSFEEYTKENIFSPLGMDSTIWEYDEADPSKLAAGYRFENGSFVEEPLEHHGAFGPMAGLITSIEDYSKYAAFHLSAWPARDGDDNGPLKRSSVRQMHQPHRITTFVSAGSCPFVLAYSYGLNWAQECNTPPYITHNGGLPGFGSNWLMVPDYGLAVISFTNQTYVAPMFLNVDVMQYIIEEANLQPRELQPSPILERRKSELETILLDTMSFEDSNIFASNFLLDNDTDLFSDELTELLLQIGTIQHVSELQPRNQLRATFRIEGEEGQLEVFFSLTPESEPLIQVLELELIE